MEVKVIEYERSWPALFELERGLLQQILWRIAVEIHHVGSTAVPGLAAKPVIDMVAEVTGLPELDTLNADLALLGYEPRGEYGIAGRRYFSKQDGLSGFHLHAFAHGDSNVMRHLAFRDYLRAHPEIAQEYGALKRSLALRCGNDIGRYCDGKDAWVKQIERAAMQEIGC